MTKSKLQKPDTSPRHQLWLAILKSPIGCFPGSQPPEAKDIKEPSRFLVTMLLQSMGEKQTQIRFKMQKDGEPVWDQVTIDRLWVTTQREAMIESGPPAAIPAAPSVPAKPPGEPTQK